MAREDLDDMYQRAAEDAGENAKADVDGYELPAQQPMSAARLAEALDAYQKCDTAYENAVSDDHRERAAIAGFWNARNVIPALAADNERLRAREAALLEVVERVAEARLTVLPYEQGALVMPPHVTNHQLREQARALLASDSADEAK